MGGGKQSVCRRSLKGVSAINRSTGYVHRTKVEKSQRLSRWIFFIFFVIFSIFFHQFYHSSKRKKKLLRPPIGVISRICLALFFIFYNTSQYRAPLYFSLLSHFHTITFTSQNFYTFLFIFVVTF